VKYEESYVMGIDTGMKIVDHVAICLMKRHSDGVLEVLDQRRIDPSEMTDPQLEAEIEKVTNFYRETYNPHIRTFRT
jgi:hypothetical protein